MIKEYSSGFTLLEILVVIIIVGVLASVAMPALMRNVERSRATEALNTMGIIRRAYLGCRSAEDPSSAVTFCDRFDNIGMEDPDNAPNSHFTYSFNCGSGVCLLWATRNAVENGDGFSQIQWEWNTGGNDTYLKQGTGVFAGIQF